MLEGTQDNPVVLEGERNYTGMRIKLGFVLRFYATAISELIKRDMKPALKVNYINENATPTPDWWLKVDFESEVEMMSPKELVAIDPLFEYAV